MTTATLDWTTRYSERMSRVRASEIRELLKLLDQPDILSFAGGIPDPALFPAARIQAGYDQILADPELSRQALQYSVSEGYLPLRLWIAERMAQLSATVSLKAVTCQGLCAKNCPRNNPLFWREAWLERVDAVAAAPPRAEAPAEPPRKSVVAA